MIVRFWELRYSLQTPGKIVATERKRGFDGLGRRVDEHTGQQLIGTFEEVKEQLDCRKASPVKVNSKDPTVIEVWF